MPPCLLLSFFVQAELERKRQAAEQERKIQAALQKIGKCSAGYQWVREGNGYRCSAGGHTASMAEIRAQMS